MVSDSDIWYNGNQVQNYCKTLSIKVLFSMKIGKTVSNKFQYFLQYVGKL